MKNQAQQVTYQDTPELEKARAAFIQENYPKSLRLFERAVKRQPNNLMALTDAARAFGQRYEIKKAQKLVDRMLMLAGDNPQIQLLAGQTKRMIYRVDDALPLLEKAACASQISPEAHLELAVLYERRHRLDEALEQVEKFLHQEPNNPEATLLKARIHRRNGDAEQASHMYEEISSRTGCLSTTKAEALNEWANVLDSQHDYQTAMEKLAESKQILIGLPETNSAQKRSDQEHRWLNHLTDSVTPAHFKNWNERESPNTPESILLTGCPRSGTTLIEKILDAHPSIISADELSAFTQYILPGLVKGKRDSEGFFDADVLDRLPAFRLKKQEQRYTQYLQEAMNEVIGDRILIDKNPSTTFLIPAYQRIWPRNRILYALRDPRDIAISCFFRWLPTNSVSVRYQTLEDTCRRPAEELETWLKLREMLPENIWHETRYEDTVANHIQESQKVLEWMGLPWDDSISDYRSHMEKRGVNSPTYAAVTQPIYTGALDRWKHYEEHLAPYMSILDPCMQALGY
jgi:tetratricopeptide (TPR) repeat protein